MGWYRMLGPFGIFILCRQILILFKLLRLWTFGHLEQSLTIGEVESEFTFKDVHFHQQFICNLFFSHFTIFSRWHIDVLQGNSFCFRYFSYSRCNARYRTPLTLNVNWTILERHEQGVAFNSCNCIDFLISFFTFHVQHLQSKCAV